MSHLAASQQGETSGTFRQDRPHGLSQRPVGFIGRDKSSIAQKDRCAGRIWAFWMSAETVADHRERGCLAGILDLWQMQAPSKIASPTSNEPAGRPSPTVLVVSKLRQLRGKQAEMSISELNQHCETGEHERDCGQGKDRLYGRDACHKRSVAPKLPCKNIGR